MTNENLLSFTVAGTKRVRGESRELRLFMLSRFCPPVKQLYFPVARSRAGNFREIYPVLSGLQGTRRTAGERVLRFAVVATIGARNRSRKLRLFMLSRLLHGGEKPVLCRTPGKRGPAQCRENYPFLPLL